MKKTAAVTQIALPERIDKRYLVTKTLGRGGMGVVYQALDTAIQREIALKQLLPKSHSGKHRNAVELFEREFHTLCQLEHPRIIEVYDYRADDKAPYYTMELLDGGDLRDLTPLPHKKACSLMADVCSALSFLHSRRMVHRDLSPRNIRCTKNGLAKLLDFGAMVPMGPCNTKVGTPPCTPPEVLNLQPLDARADLYSLGATLYYALTGRYAFPAHEFGHLRDLWRSPPLPPSQFAAGIPKSLDSLVLSLLSIDPNARPANAAEAMERLCATAGIELDEHLLVRQAYLAAPTLVGRQEALLRVRKLVIRARRDRGGGILIKGPSGVGRSRFLDACVLEGKIAGAIVLRADSRDSASGDWGAARALASQLLDAFPHPAQKTAGPHMTVLAQLLPELAADLPEAELQTSRQPEVQRRQVHAALRSWFLNLAASQCIMVAVDDVHQLDEPSAAFLALLAQQADEHGLVLAVSMETDAEATSPMALKLLRQASVGVSLQDLSPEHTRELLSSRFGEVPNLELLADRLYAVSQGNPTAVMQIAQHMVDRGVLRYEAGAWTLPSRIAAGDVPDNLNETLRTRAEKLSGNALKLAQMLALSPRQRFSFEECLNLTQVTDKARLIQDLNELTALEIVSTDGHYYSLKRRGWASVLTDQLVKDRAYPLHLRLAEVFSRRGTQACRAAKHFFEAGEEERALDVLARDAQITDAQIVQSSEAFSQLVMSLPPDWMDIYERALEVCRRLNRARGERFLLQIVLMRISSHSNLENRDHVADVIEQLTQDSGLRIYGELGETIDAQTRLQRALELAQQRFEACPESERVLPPAKAIAELANTISNVTGLAGCTFDHSLVEALPSLKPLSPLSPALGIIDSVITALIHLYAGRSDQAVSEIEAILQRVHQPDRAGLEELTYRNTRFGLTYAKGLVEAGRGLKSSLQCADEIEPDPLHQVNAWRIRMVYCLRQGDIEEAERCKKQMELLQIQNNPMQYYEGTSLYPELLAYSLSDDLVRVKRTVESMVDLAERFSNWRPILHFGRGEYQRIRGNHQSALKEHEQALRLMAPGRHLTWPYAVGAYLKTLFELERFQEAREMGRQSLAAAERESIGTESNWIRMPLALVEAKLGEHDRAVANLEAAIDTLNALGTTGINLGIAYEIRAQIAVYANDHTGFRTWARMCGKQYRAGRNPVLTAKYERLMQEARSTELSVSTEMECAGQFADSDDRRMAQLISSRLTTCAGRRERAKAALDVLIEQSGCWGGFLYTLESNGPSLCAQSGNLSRPADLDKRVSDYLYAEMNDSENSTMTASESEDLSGTFFSCTGQMGKECHPLLLGHSTREGFAITGMAILYRNPGDEFRLPAEAIPVLSRSLLEAGDVAPLIASGSDAR